MKIAVLWSVCCLALCGPALSHLSAQDKPKDDGVRWMDVKELGLEGQGWTDTKAPYDRLPARAEGKVRDAVWNLSRHSAGLCVRFVTDSPKIHARWTVTSSNLAMPHMAATGVSGVDLYARDDRGRWRWVAVGQPKAVTNEIVLAQGLRPGKREYLVYLPLYNGTASAEIGVPTGASLEQAPAYPPERAKPIVYYGTSITHGACASRTGMVHAAILQRRYDRPAINLGFSGNGRMEPEVGAFLVELDPAIYVIDCCPNMSGEETAAKTKPLVEQLRKARPETPIVLVEDRRYTDAWLNESKGQRNDGNHAALKKAYEELIAAGAKNLYYIPGDDLLGEDGDGAVDSSHPNDLGFLRQADAFDKVLGPVLKSAGR
ncbi:SGNH/GDSL hydrolase family protein [Planctellipticum variicoloris]|uniref:SGNH/GDSL hydrolase family protein n=1 Tax=Planctellipticum variicoloris TaxID=3064265 RepID=UPI00301330CE